MSQAIVITGDRVVVARMLVIASAMNLELRTGMGRRGRSVFAVAHEMGWTTKPRKHRDRLGEMIKSIQAVYPEYEPNANMLKTLEMGK